MSKYDRYIQENNRISNEIIQNAKKEQKIFCSIENDTKRVSSVIDKVNIIVENADTQFEKATKLGGFDITLLFAATALQCVRQYLIGSITQRTNDQAAAKKTHGHYSEHSARKHRLYNPSLEEIIGNPVPYDVSFGSKDFNLGVGGGFTHRAKTLGHDPLMGWIFGTGNIATSTVTLSEGLRTFHVLTGTTSVGAARDKISMNASTVKMLNFTKNKLLCEGMEGKEKIGISIMKEAIHLKSDMYSTASLPIPVVSTISVDAARKLAGYGIDMGNVVKVSNQAGFAVLINSLIGMLHGLFYDESVHGSWSLYSVKTRKILSYSNLIASLSNVIAVAIGTAIGIASDNPEAVRKSLNYLDIGGFIVTVHRLITDQKFITEIKKEFITNEWQNAVLNGGIKNE